jgi:hypothetical protein
MSARFAYELHAHTVAFAKAWASQALPVPVTHRAQQAVAPDTGRDIIGTAETRFALSASSSATGAEAILSARSWLLPNYLSPLESARSQTTVPSGAGASCIGMVSVAYITTGAMARQSMAYANVCPRSLPRVVQMSPCGTAR